MDNNDKKTDKQSETLAPEIVSMKKKLTRKFSWTPARKAAFDKCIAARKKGLKPKSTEAKPEVKPQPEPKPEPELMKPKLKRQREVINESSSSDDELSTSSAESIKAPVKKRKSTKTKKQFLKLTQELQQLKRAKNNTIPKIKPRKKLERKYIRTPIDSEDEVEAEKPTPVKTLPPYYFI